MDIVHITVTAKNLDTVPIVNGQIIAISDKSAYYYDMANVRHRVTSIEHIAVTPTPESVVGIDGVLYIVDDPPGLWIFEHDEFVPIIAGAIKVEVSGEGNVVTDLEPDNMKLTVKKDFTAASQADVQKHVNTKAGNPHGVTKEDVGLGDVENKPDSERSVLEATKLKTARAVDGVSFDGTKDINRTGTCETAAATAAKTVTIADFKLQDYAVINVRFIEGNTAANPTLAVNGTAAFNILYLNSPITDSQKIRPNSILTLVYLNKAYHISGGVDTTYSDATDNVSGLLSAELHKKLVTIEEGATADVPYDQNPEPLGTASPGSADEYARGDHVHPLPAELNTNAATASKLKKPVYIDGAEFDGSKNIKHYGVCSTAAEESNKDITIKDVKFDLTDSATIVVKFTETNTTLPITMSINGGDRFDLKLNGAPLNDPNLLLANSIAEIVFTGDAFEVVNITGAVATNFTAADRAKFDGIEEGATRVLPGNTTPLVSNAKGSPGSSDKYSREDHVHPVPNDFRVPYANSASKLESARTIELEGDVIGQAEFDGSQDIKISTEIVGGVFDYNKDGFVPGPTEVKANIRHLAEDATWVPSYQIYNGSADHLNAILEEEADAPCIKVHIAGTFTASTEEVPTITRSKHMILDFSGATVTGAMTFTGTEKLEIKNLHLSTADALVLDGPVELEDCVFNDAKIGGTVSAPKSFIKDGAKSKIAFRDCTFYYSFISNMFSGTSTTTTQVDVQNCTIYVTGTSTAIGAATNCLFNGVSSACTFANNRILCTDEALRKAAITRMIRTTANLDASYNNYFQIGAV